MTRRAPLRRPSRSPPGRWLEVRAAGLYCRPGDFYIDPTRGVDRAVVTHGHGDHARPGSRRVLATAETIAIMTVRHGAEAIGATQALAYGDTVSVGDARVRLAPAGHILGSAQIVIEHGGGRVVVSGDYKRRGDATCAPFEPQAADLFVTEATFALPVFRHPPDGTEIAKLLRSLELFPDRAHLVGVYNLGKCQRIVRLLRQAGYDKPIYLHTALEAMCALYQRLGIALEPLLPARDLAGAEAGGEIVLCPPGALRDRWSRRFADPLLAMASGWMGVRQRARQRGVELPLIVSDHADWNELTDTIDEVAAPQVWITHGREEALVHHATVRGYAARALELTGFDEDSA